MMQSRILQRYNGSLSQTIGRKRCPLQNPRHSSLFPCRGRKDGREAKTDDHQSVTDKTYMLVPKLVKRRKQRGQLRLFLDTADVKQWELWAPTGTLYGFTTNPTILEKDGVPCTLKAIKRLVDTAHSLHAQELQAQAWGTTADQLEAVSLKLLDLDPDLITVKLPCTPEGLQAASRVMAKAHDCSITMTGVYEHFQVLACMAVGADYMAPYLGRIWDRIFKQEAAGNNVMRRDETETAAIEVVATMQQAVHGNDSSMRVLVASIRSPTQMVTLAAKGCDTFTFSPSVMEQLAMVGPTLVAAEDFEAAAARNRAVPFAASAST